MKGILRNSITARSSLNHFPDHERNIPSLSRILHLTHKLSHSCYHPPLTPKEPAEEQEKRSCTQGDFSRRKGREGAALRGIFHVEKGEKELHSGKKIKHVRRGENQGGQPLERTKTSLTHGWRKETKAAIIWPSQKAAHGIGTLSHYHKNTPHPSLKSSLGHIQKRAKKIRGLSRTWTSPSSPWAEQKATPFADLRKTEGTDQSSQVETLSRNSLGQKMSIAPLTIPLSQIKKNRGFLSATREITLSPSPPQVLSHA